MSAFIEILFSLPEAILASILIWEKMPACLRLFERESRVVPHLFLSAKKRFLPQIEPFGDGKPGLAIVEVLRRP